VLEARLADMAKVGLRTTEQEDPGSLNPLIGLNPKVVSS
jgi:hypothetical protein